MKTFIKPFAVAVMLLFAGASFAQPAHHYSKHHKHHKHHRKVHHVEHRLHN